MSGDDARPSKKNGKQKQKNAKRVCIIFYSSVSSSVWNVMSYKRSRKGELAEGEPLGCV